MSPKCVCPNRHKHTYTMCASCETSTSYHSSQTKSSKNTHNWTPVCVYPWHMAPHHHDPQSYAIVSVHTALCSERNSFCMFTKIWSILEVIYAKSDTKAIAEQTKIVHDLHGATTEGGTHTASTSLAAYDGNCSKVGLWNLNLF